MQEINTLGALIADGYALTAHCGECRHSQRLDLEGLAERLGAGFVTIGDPNPLAARLHCSACGSKAIGLILGAPGGSTPGLGIYGQKG